MGASQETSRAKQSRERNSTPLSCLPRERLLRQTARSRPLLRPNYAPVQGFSRPRSLRARPRPPAAPPRRASSRGRARRALGGKLRAPSASMGRAGASASSSWARRGPGPRARPLRWRRVGPWALVHGRAGARKLGDVWSLFSFALLCSVVADFLLDSLDPRKRLGFKRNKIWLLSAASGGESRRYGSEEGIGEAPVLFMQRRKPARLLLLLPFTWSEERRRERERRPLLPAAGLSLSLLSLSFCSLTLSFCRPGKENGEMPFLESAFALLRPWAGGGESNGRPYFSFLFCRGRERLTAPLTPFLFFSLFRKCPGSRRGLVSLLRSLRPPNFDAPNAAGQTPPWITEEAPSSLAWLKPPLAAATAAARAVVLSLTMPMQSSATPAGTGDHALPLTAARFPNSIQWERSLETSEMTQQQAIGSLTTAWRQVKTERRFRLLYFFHFFPLRPRLRLTLCKPLKKNHFPLSLSFSSKSLVVPPRDRSAILGKRHALRPAPPETRRGLRQARGALRQSLGAEGRGRVGQGDAPGSALGVAGVGVVVRVIVIEREGFHHCHQRRHQQQQEQRSLASSGAAARAPGRSLPAPRGQEGARAPLPLGRRRGARCRPPPPHTRRGGRGRGRQGLRGGRGARRGRGFFEEGAPGPAEGEQ